jgi:hypothetical protein
MSFFLVDSEGFVSDISTAKGWSDVSNALKKLRNTPLSSFLATGETTKPDVVASEINQVLPFIDDKSIVKTLTNLQAGLKKCKDIAIISQ